jgi:hypothetical protein
MQRRRRRGGGIGRLGFRGAQPSGWALAGVCTVACFGYARTAGATPSDTKAQCLGAYEEGQRQRKAGTLVQARETFTFCASDACPRALHGDCSRWLSEAVEATPKVVFRVSNSSGEELDGVRVRLDGGESRPAVEGPVELDPGVHVALLERADHRSSERRFTVSERETLTLEVMLAPAVGTRPALAATSQPGSGLGSTARAERQRLSLTPIWIGAGLGAAGAASFTYFGLKARAADRSLDSCTPSCDKAKVESIERDYLLANVSLGAGVLGVLGAGAWALFGPRTADTGVTVATQGLKVRIGTTTWVSGTF